MSALSLLGFGSDSQHERREGLFTVVDSLDGAWNILYNRRFIVENAFKRLEQNPAIQAIITAELNDTQRQMMMGESANHREHLSFIQHLTAAVETESPMAANEAVTTPTNEAVEPTMDVSQLTNLARSLAEPAGARAGQLPKDFSPDALVSSYSEDLGNAS